jgi:ABC-type Fe3+-hydroxamate transport system substrate-binding protein
MKTLILSFLATAAVLSVSACTTVVETPEAAPTTTTTTTEKATVHHPLGTTETKTTRTY